MRILLILPALVGILAGYLINYLADVLPDSLKLGIPECQNQACKKPYSCSNYLLLRRCRTCGQQRRLRTFLILALAISAALYIWLSPPARLGFALGLVLLAYLLLIAVIDIEHRLVLKPLSITGYILIGLAGSMMHGWKNTALGGMFNFGVMVIFYLIGTRITLWIVKKQNQEGREVEETFGSGDVTLATILGLFLGWPLTAYGLLLGVLILGVVVIPLACALFFRRRSHKQALVYIPIGPPFILSTILLIYLQAWVSRLLPK